MSRRRRRGTGVEVAPVETKKKKSPRFWTVLWIIIGLLAFIAITSFTGFFAPDIYMLGIFAIVIVILNIYLFSLIGKDT